MNRTCPLCDKPIARHRREYVCVDCERDTIAKLDDLPWLLAQLDMTVARQYVTGDHMTHSGESPMPFDERAAHVALRVVEDLHLLVGDEYKHLDTRAQAEWLRDNLSDLLRSPDAAMRVRQIQRIVKRIEHVIDRPPDRTFVGRCGARITPPEGVDGVWECDQQIYAEIGAAMSECPRCGARHDVAKRRESMRREINAMLFTITEISRLASIYDGIPSAKTLALLKIWQHRGRIVPRSFTSRGVPLYPFGETIREVMSAQKRRATRRDAR